MPTDDYTAVGGGGLRIKGAKVHKKKKKKKTKTPDAERALAAAADDDKAPATEDEPAAGSAQRRGADAHADAPPDDAAALKTDAERRYDEIKRKRVRRPLPPPRGASAALTTQHTAPRHGALVGRAPRAAQDTQGARRGAQHVPVQAQRAPRHAQDWARLSGPRGSARARLTCHVIYSYTPQMAAPGPSCRVAVHVPPAWLRCGWRWPAREAGRAQSGV